MSRKGKKRQKKFSKRVNVELSHLFHYFLFTTIPYQKEDKSNMFEPMEMKVLKSIIEERKCERKKRAELKRQEDLRTIEKLNTNNNAGIDPLIIFPEEMWEKVSNYLVDYQDLASFQSTCSLFRYILKNRLDLLLAKAFQIEDLYNQVKSDYEYNFLYKGLNCKSMDRALYWQDQKVHAEEALSVCREFRDFLPNWYNPSPSSEARSIERYVTYLKNLASSIDPNRSLCNTTSCRDFIILIDVDLLENHLDLLNLITNALQHAGGDIWDFDLQIANGRCMENLKREMVFAQLYLALVKWVSLMPNIHLLKISEWLGISYCPSSMDGVSFSIPPFPHLKSLKQLNLSFKLESNILEAILEANGHIQSLVIKGNSFTCERARRLIKSVNPKSFCYKNSSMDAADQTHVESCLNFNWPLKEINLQLFFETISMPRLFKMLGCFKTLETVFLNISLEGRRTYSDDDWSDYGNASSDDERDTFYENVEEKRRENGHSFLQLPNLTKFKFEFEGKMPEEVDGGSYFRSIDYLLLCKKLETLEYSNRYYNQSVKLKAREELIQFQGGCMNLDWSNMWFIFPFLESVKISNNDQFSHDYIRHEDTFNWQNEFYDD